MLALLYRSLLPSNDDVPNRSQRLRVLVSRVDSFAITDDTIVPRRAWTLAMR
jgi:hypothetical protein